jgi:hypothetical protein
MPQLSLYLDDNTLRRIQEAAQLSNESVSKWVAKQLKMQLHNQWPPKYFSLFGSVDDPSFSKPEAIDADHDITREPL